MQTRSDARRRARIDNVGVDRALAGLRGEDVAAVALTFIATPALEGVYWGAASGPAEALAAFAAELDIDLVFVPAQEPWADEAAGRLREVGVGVAWAVAAVLGRVAESQGWPEVLRLSAADPGSLAHPLASALHDALVEARTGLTRRADVIVVADDLASSKGWLVSPDFALDALVPCYRSLAAESAAAGVSAVFHSDGDVRPLLGALRSAGFAGVHPGGLDREHLGPFVRAANAAGMSALGGLEAASLFESPSAQADAALELAANAQLIIADDGGVASAEDLAAYASAIRRIRARG